MDAEGCAALLATTVTDGTCNEESNESVAVPVGINSQELGCNRPRLEKQRGVYCVQDTRGVATMKRKGDKKLSWTHGRGK